MYVPPISAATATDALARLPGFGPGAQVMTDKGGVPVEWLATGDRVLTRDHGLQPVLWIGHVRMSAERLARQPWLVPREIIAGALGVGQPDHATLLAPCTGILLTGWQVELHTGSNEALADIGDLTDGKIIMRPSAVAEQRFTYLLLPQHAVVQVNGLWAESLLLDANARAALAGVLPASIVTRRDVETGHAQAAHRCLTDWEVRAILGGRSARGARIIDRVA